MCFFPNILKHDPSFEYLKKYPYVSKSALALFSNDPHLIREANYLSTLLKTFLAIPEVSFLNQSFTKPKLACIRPSIRPCWITVCLCDLLLNRVPRDLTSLVPSTTSFGSIAYLVPRACIQAVFGHISSVSLNSVPLNSRLTLSNICCIAYRWTAGLRRPATSSSCVASHQ